MVFRRGRSQRITCGPYMRSMRPGSSTRKSSQCVTYTWPVYIQYCMSLYRMPAYQTDTPVLVLNCDREFETDQEQADLHLEKVAEFIESLHKKTV